MSIATLILGHSGSGKTASLRNLDPSKVLLIQPIRKPLPFKKAGWKEYSKKNPAGKRGNIIVRDDPQMIVYIMRNLDKVDDTKAPPEIVIIDDWQYVLSNLYMAKRDEKSFEKFNEIGGGGFDIVKTASELAPSVRVYVLAHTQVDEFGNTKIKTLGRLLDEKIVVEGMFSTVLGTVVEGGKYYFTTKNSGSNTVKAPMGMFEQTLIENDLALVDSTICDYFEITTGGKKR